jgi:hypothetical protein
VECVDSTTIQSGQYPIRTSGWNCFRAKRPGSVCFSASHDGSRAKRVIIITGNLGVKTLAFFSNPRRALWRCSARPFIFLFAVAVFALVPCRADDSAIAAAKELAHKLAAQLDVKAGITIDIRDLTNQISASDLSAALQAIKDELHSLGAPSTVSGTPVRITLSENSNSRLWIADFPSKDDPEKRGVLFVRFGQAESGTSTAPHYAVQIQAKSIYEQPAPFLDFSVLKRDNDQPTLVAILKMDSILILQPRGQSWQVLDGREIPQIGAPSRDPQGRMEFSSEQDAVVYAESQKCQVQFNGKNAVLTCVSATNSFTASGSSPSVPAACGSTEVAVAAGTGDYTEPDRLQAFTSKDRVQTASEPIDLPGPVMALFANPPRAVVRNLSTGNYEAYEISLSCNH